MHRLTYFILGLLFLTVSYGLTESYASVTLDRQFFLSADSLHPSIDLVNENILGVWTNCAMAFGGLVVNKANICKLIEFKNDHTAVITYPSKERQTVDWMIKDNLLVINLKGNKSDVINRTLTDSLYEVHVSQNTTSIEFELKAKNKDVVYYLWRQK